MEWRAEEASVPKISLRPVATRGLIAAPLDPPLASLCSRGQEWEAAGCLFVAMGWNPLFWSRQWGPPHGYLSTVLEVVPICTTLCFDWGVLLRAVHMAPLRRLGSVSRAAPFWPVLSAVGGGAWQRLHPRGS